MQPSQLAPIDRHRAITIKVVIQIKAKIKMAWTTATATTIVKLNQHLHHHRRRPCPVINNKFLVSIVLLNRQISPCRIAMVVVILTVVVAKIDVMPQVGTTMPARMIIDLNYLASRSHWCRPTLLIGVQNISLTRKTISPPQDARTARKTNNESGECWDAYHIRTFVYANWWL